MVSAPTAASLTGLVASRIRALARSSRGCIRNQRRSCRMLSGVPRASALDGMSRLCRFTGQDQHGILAAEAERVRHYGGDTGIARFVGDDVEGNGRIRDIVIDGRWNPLVFERQQREDCLDSASGGEGMS